MSEPTRIIRLTDVQAAIVRAAVIGYRRSCAEAVRTLVQRTGRPYREEIRDANAIIAELKAAQQERERDDDN